MNNHISVNKNLRERIEHLLEEANKYEEIDKLKKMKESEGAAALEGLNRKLK